MKLSAKPNANQLARPTSMHGPVRFGLALIATTANAHDQMHLDDPSVVDRTIFVDAIGVRATDFDLSDETRDALFANGLGAGREFLAGWSFDRLLETYWKAGEPLSNTAG